MSIHRFFAPSLDPGDETATLPRDEAEHMTRVLRHGVGDTVGIFDGRGHEFLARIVSIEGRGVRVQIMSRVDAAVESTVALTLAQAVLKGDKMDDVIRDAVMLGVAAVQPLVTSRTETTVAALVRGARLDRWKRVALASVKQSRRAVLPDIRTPLTLENFLDEPAPALSLMLVEPAAGGPRVPGGPGGIVESLSALRKASVPMDAAVLVGPEGGWAEAEWTSASAHGVRLMTLGDRTLRADAVAVSAISVLQFLWDQPEGT